MRVLAPAKINLFLRVGPRRGDGFHPLSTWMVTVGLFDTLRLTPLPNDPGAPPLCLSVTPHPATPPLPTDDRNLIVRAASAFAAAIVRDGAPPPTPLSGVLDKRISTGAGLGGGSSDAASTLLALNHLWQAGWPLSRLANLAASLGSDVPFFLHPPSALCTGRGEIITPVPPPPFPSVLLILPPIHMPTPEVYKRFDEMGLGTDLASLPNPYPLTPNPSSLFNDLEPPAFSLRPDLARLRSDIEQSLSRPVRMSGSGSTLFTLYDSPTEASEAALLVMQRHGTTALAADLAPVIKPLGSQSH